MATHEPGRENSDDTLLEAIDAIYGCVTEPGAFEDLPGVLTSVLQASSVTVWCIDTSPTPALAFSHGSSDRCIGAYIDRWLQSDPLTPTALQSHFGHSANQQAMIGEGHFRRLSVFDERHGADDVVRPMGHFDFVDARWLAGLIAERGHSDPPVCENDRRRMDTLFHHLRRAIHIAAQLDLMSARAAGAEAVLSNCNLATWLLDGEGCVHASNDAAERIAATRDSGIVNARGGLRFTDAELDAAFRSILGQLEAGRHAPVELPLHADRRRSFNRGAIMPIDHDGNGAVGLQHLYLLVLARPAADADVDCRQLESRLPVSRAEADVLTRLMRAQDPRAIAEARGSKLETIRGYEKSLRTKLGCHSRAELVSEGWSAITVIPVFGDAGNG